MPRIFLNSEITFLLNSVQQVIHLLFKIFTLLVKILIRYQTSDSTDSFVESEEEEEDSEPHCRCRACAEVERKRILLKHHRRKADLSLFETGDTTNTTTNKEREEESDT